MFNTYFPATKSILVLSDPSRTMASLSPLLPIPYTPALAPELCITHQTTSDTMPETTPVNPLTTSQDLFARPAPPTKVRLVVQNCRCAFGACGPACGSDQWLLKVTHPLFHESVLLGPRVRDNRLGPRHTLRVLGPIGADVDDVEYLLEFARRELVAPVESAPTVGEVRRAFRIYRLAHLFAMPRYCEVLRARLLAALGGTAAAAPVSSAEVAYVFATLPPHDAFRAELTHVLARRLVRRPYAIDEILSALEAVPEFAFDLLAVLAALADAPVEECGANALKDVMLECRHSCTYAAQRAAELAGMARRKRRFTLPEVERHVPLQRAQRLLRYAPLEDAEWI